MAVRVSAESGFDPAYMLRGQAEGSAEKTAGGYYLNAYHREDGSVLVSWVATEQSPEEGTILRRSKETGCVFLDGMTCTVYDARPETCQKFPHVVRGSGSIASRMWQFADRACYCPIVYNSLEAFKKELGFTR